MLLASARRVPCFVASAIRASCTSNSAAAVIVVVDDSGKKGAGTSTSYKHPSGGLHAAAPAPDAGAQRRHSGTVVGHHRHGLSGVVHEMDPDNVAQARACVDDIASTTIIYFFLLV